MPNTEAMRDIIALSIGGAQDLSTVLATYCFYVIFWSIFWWCG
jgi:hypothetical protein